MVARRLGATLFLVIIFFSFLGAADPLPSWNEGVAKTAILTFVNEVTAKGGANYISPENRIVTFDEDGTLWVEHPIYTEMYFVLDRIKEMAPQLPEWEKLEPFKSILAEGINYLKELKQNDVVALITATHAGMSIEEFHTIVNNWLKTAVHPVFKKPFTELVYQPMIEVMQLLKDNQFIVYIASGGGQEFMRAFTEELYGLSPNRIIGSAGKIDYHYNHGKPDLYKIPEILFINDKKGKPEGINLVIGKKPIAAFGNSTGDKEMLEWSQSYQGKTIQLLVHHDDNVREFAYGPDTLIGTFSDELMKDAHTNGWYVISMKNDWKVIFK